MRRQRVQPNETPYTKLLSALRKTELLRLCIEFRLPTDGSVVTLRTRLKDHLNLNRNTLYRNPRYTALFPRHTRPKQPPPSPRTSASRTPTLDYKTPSPAPSDVSWHGLGGPQHPQGQLHHQPVVPQGPQPSPSPSVFNSERGSPSPIVHDANGCKLPSFAQRPFFFFSIHDLLFSFLVILSSDDSGQPPLFCPFSC
jgi:hypothetical protein